MDDDTIEKHDDGLYRRSAGGLEKLSIIAEIDFYLDQIARFGPERNVGAYHLAYPERQLRWLCCVRASQSDTARRPQAIIHATRAWLLDLEKLEATIVQNTGDQAMWRLTWGALDDHIRILELETPELRARLDRLREPPSPTPEGIAEEAEMNATMREMVAKAISKLPT